MEYRTAWKTLHFFPLFFARTFLHDSIDDDDDDDDDNNNYNNIHYDVWVYEKKCDKFLESRVLAPGSEFSDCSLCVCR